MNTAQIIAVATAFISLLAAIIGGGWVNQRAIERQMEAFRNEIKAELGAFRGEMKGELAEVRGESGSIRSELRGVSDRLERIERQLDQIFKPVLPKTGD